MAAIGLSLLAAFGFAGSAILARQDLQAVFPLLGVMVSLFFTFLLAYFMVLLFATSGIGRIPRAAIIWIIGLGVINIPGGRPQNFLSVNMIGASRTGPEKITRPLATIAGVPPVVWSGQS